jgi:hypothetical protein
VHVVVVIGVVEHGGDYLDFDRLGLQRVDVGDVVVAQEEGQVGLPVVVVLVMVEVALVVVVMGVARVVQVQGAPS